MEPLTLNQILASGVAVAASATSAPVGLDPNFVQHGLDDIAVRFFGYLAFILAYSTVIHGSVRAAFTVFGVDLKDTWWDDVAIATLGIFFALCLDWNSMFYIAGITNEQYVKAMPIMATHGSPAAWFNPTLVIAVCNVLTGALVIGGRKSIVGIAEEFQKGLGALKEILNRKTGNGTTNGKGA